MIIGFVLLGCNSTPKPGEGNYEINIVEDAHFDFFPANPVQNKGHLTKNIFVTIRDNSIIFNPVLPEDLSTPNRDGFQYCLIQGVFKDENGNMLRVSKGVYGGIGYASDYAIAYVNKAGSFGFGGYTFRFQEGGWHLLGTRSTIPINNMPSDHNWVVIDGAAKNVIWWK